MRRRISIRGCVRPFVGPSVRGSVSIKEKRGLGASYVGYPALNYEVTCRRLVFWMNYEEPQNHRMKEEGIKTVTITSATRIGPRQVELGMLLVPFSLDVTARLDIGKRFKRTNITQTVPNVSSNVP